MKLKPGKGLNPVHQASLIRVIGLYIGVITPQLYLILVISLWMAQNAWQQNFETLTTVEAQQAQQRQITLDRQPVPVPAMESLLARVIRMSPRTKAALADADGNKAISISIEKAEDLDAFREALLLVVSSEEGALWEITQLCMGTCAGGSATATLYGKKQRIEVK